MISLLIDKQNKESLFYIWAFFDNHKPEVFPEFSYLETYIISHIFNIFEMTLNKMRQKDTQGRYTLSLLMTIHIFLFIDIQKQSLKSVVSMEQTLFGF